MRQDLAELPAWQREIELRVWEILRSAGHGGCPNHAQLRTLTARLDAVAAGRANASVFVLGCRRAHHGGKV
jgi:hypothetical protein